MSRNTKIVATYGPAVASEDALTALISAGADVLRLNFSHGEYSEHEAAVKLIRKVSTKLGKSVAILQDLRGPKIRVGVLCPEPVMLREDDVVTLVPHTEIEDVSTGGPPIETEAARLIPIEGYPTLHEDIAVGEMILLADGAIALRVGAIDGVRIRCDVVVEGEISSHKGVNFPESRLRTLETITEKDVRDLEFGLAHGVDWIALSFVRSAADVEELKRRIASHGSEVPVIAKIEKREALRNLEEIVSASDGVMVARGDLGVETELEEVVLRQKEIIRACNRRGRVVITATQMLESMMHHPTPTRAEVADVSNAIFDGTDALMLSGETAVGEYPVEAVSFMARAAEQVEEALDADRLLAQRPFLDEVPDAVAHAACMTAHEIAAEAMICLTRSGLTARLVSRYRPRCPVIAVSPEERTIRRLAIHWGVLPVLLTEDLDGEALVEGALAKARSTGLLAEGDRVVITAGVSPGVLRGKTNLIRAEVL
ncbi:pyruvate kinase [Candidatus Eisenbacteria bacterium]|uniref:Pyruvate kinase n=1 Tax=Eiseniibacteriota bacterium TaxID=2212470 RepID=A0ABV6YJZ7_UNCEI